MSKYVVFVTEDEEAWEARSDAGRQEVYDADAASSGCSNAGAGRWRPSRTDRLSGRPATSQSG